MRYLRPLVLALLLAALPALAQQVIPWHDPSPHKVQLVPRADHYVFLTNEAGVLREMRAFIEQLP